MPLLTALAGQRRTGKIDMCCWHVLAPAGDITVWWEWWNDVETGQNRLCYNVELLVAALLLVCPASTGDSLH